MNYILKRKTKKQLTDAITDAVIKETTAREYARAVRPEEIEHDVWQEVLKENIKQAYTYYFTDYSQDCAEEVPHNFIPVMGVIDNGFYEASLAMAQITAQENIARAKTYCTNLAAMDDEQFSAFIQEKIAEKVAHLKRIDELTGGKKDDDYQAQIQKVIITHLNNRQTIRENGLDKICEMIVEKKGSADNLAYYQTDYLELIKNSYSFPEDEQQPVSYPFVQTYQEFDQKVSAAVENAILDENEYNDEVESRVNHYLALRDMNEADFDKYLDKVIANLTAAYSQILKPSRILQLIKKSK